MTSAALVEARSGNAAASKATVRRYAEISQQLHGSQPVSITHQSEARAAREKPHLEAWGAQMGVPVRSDHNPGMGD